MTKSWMVVSTIVIVLLFGIMVNVMAGNGAFDPPSPNRCINPIPGAKQVLVPCMSGD